MLEQCTKQKIVSSSRALALILEQVYAEEKLYRRALPEQVKRTRGLAPG
jgi:hypothetical protein